MARQRSFFTSSAATTLFESARRTVENRYQRAEYPYLSDQLPIMYSNFIGWLDAGLNPQQQLKDALQDERTIFDQHNRLQAKALFRGEDTSGLSEDLNHFPLRKACIHWMVVLAPAGFEPIFQVEDQPETWKAAAQQARENVAIGSTGPDDSELATSLDSPAKGTACNAEGTRLGKMRDAPSPEHDFPDANFTLAEIAAFVPHSIKSWDVADRSIWHGAGQEDLQKMMNKYRSMPWGKVDNNSVYMMIRGQMRRRSKAEHDYDHWKTWVVGDQKDVQKPRDYDPDSVSVTNFRRPINYQTFSKEAADPVPFQDLARGVSVWPDGNDALDLTRCVAWCVDHPEEKYYYPTDYSKVLKRVGGPIAPGKDHTDAAVLSRLRAGTGRTHPRTRTMPSRIPNKIAPGTSDTTTQAPKRKRGDDSPTITRSKRPKTTAVASTQATRNIKQLKTSRAYASRIRIDGTEDDTEDETYQGPKRVKNNKQQPRRSSRSKRAVNYSTFAIEVDE